MKSRSIDDLVIELQTEAQKAKTKMAAIVVGFEHETKFVFVGNPDPVKALTDFVQAGGQPMGIFMFVAEKDELGRKTSEMGDCWCASFANGLMQSG